MTTLAQLHGGAGKEAAVEMPSSMEDVAARAGVSVSTVSRALRDSPLVSEATRLRVHAAAEELSFAVSRAASSLATGRLGRVAVLVGGHLGPWFNGTMLDAMYEQLRAANLDLLVYRITDLAERQAFFERLPARRNADALIVASFALTAAEHERLEALGMPVVYLNQEQPGAPSVSIDDVAGARAGTRYLLNLGHRRFAFVHGRHEEGFAWSATRRVHGFSAEVAAAGLTAADYQTLAFHGETDADAVVAQLLSGHELPTAVFAESDEIALALLPALRRVGLGMPEDLSLLGFDDHEMAARFGLSTVAQPVFQMARKTADLAIALADGGSPEQTRIRVEARLVPRLTTGPPRSPVASAL
jgi:DNA-binding LacI/PurR family transcriptional regulator